MKQALLIALAALAFAPRSMAAEDHLAARAAASLGPVLGQWIAGQGNAALVQIREEMEKDLLKRIEPYLPAREATAAEPRPQTNSDPAL